MPLPLPFLRALLPNNRDFDALTGPSSFLDKRRMVVPPASSRLDLLRDPRGRTPTPSSWKSEDIISRYHDDNINTDHRHSFHRTDVYSSVIFGIIITIIVGYIVLYCRTRGECIHTVINTSKWFSLSITWRDSAWLAVRHRCPSTVTGRYGGWQICQFQVLSAFGYRVGRCGSQITRVNLWGQYGFTAIWRILAELY